MYSEWTFQFESGKMCVKYLNEKHLDFSYEYSLFLDLLGMTMGLVPAQNKALKNQLKLAA